MAGVGAAPLLAGAVAAVLAPAPLFAQTAPPPATLPTTEVIGTTPLLGSGVDRDKVPSNVRTLSRSDLDVVDAPRLTEGLDRRLGSITINSQEGSSFQPNVQYRGFDASPIAGTPQGLAVYQNGVRINEAFGDTVNWDLLPEFAVERVNVISGSPVFGLNALGGAIAIEMKNGFNSPGGQIELSGGSFGRVETIGEYGIKAGNFASYVGGRLLYEDGFRDRSPSRLRQLYADVGAEKDGVALHLSFTGAANLLNGTGPAPLQLLDRSRSAVFTTPQSINHDVAFVTLGGSVKASETVSVEGNVYYRHFRQRLIDGNTSDVVPCEDAGFLCLGDDDTRLFSPAGPVPDILGGATAGQTERVTTRTDGYGGSLQTTLTTPVFGLGNRLTFGGAIDRGETRYAAFSELGIISSTDLVVGGTGFVISQPDGSLSPVQLETTNTYYGLYFTDTLDLTPKLAVTLGGRFNLAFIDLADQLGTALNGSHRFSRFNPGGGVTYKIAPEVTAYASYSEANRAPTPGELACADPLRPCVLAAFLVADPPLRQVVARTWETGLRGAFAAGTGRVTWNLGLYRTDSEDDIINVASPLGGGLGFFRNAGDTRRQGIEAGIGFRSDDWSVYADYALVDATFRDDLVLSSPNNPAADAAGNIFVRPGNRLPLVPEHRIKLGADYRVLPGWRVGADLVAATGQFYFGDQSNQNSEIPGYWVVHLRTAYEVTRNFEVFARINNLFDKRYANFGTFVDLGSVPPSLALTDPRSQSPAAPLAVFVGVRAFF